MYTEGIPRIIYQTWETKELHPDMHAAMQTWIDLNPEYEHKLFDANDRRRYVEQNYPPRVLEAYDKLRPGTYQTDFWRYCILYKTGGVNVDIDCVCLAPLRDTIEDEDTFVSGLAPSYEFAIWVGFVAAQKDHPFLKVCLDHVVRNIETDFYGKSGVWPTGPVAAGIAVNRLGGYPDRQPYKLGINTRHNISFKLLNFVRQHKSVFNEAGDEIMITKYEGYSPYRNATIIPYHKAWREGKIYHYDNPSRVRAIKQAWRMVTTTQGRRHSRNVMRKKFRKLLKRIRAPLRSLGAWR